MVTWTTQKRWRARGALRATILAAVLGATASAAAQPAHHSGPYAAACLPLAERAGREVGCWITATEALGELPRETPLHWHLDAYPTRAAAEAAKGPRGTVVESLGRVWLFTVAEAGWRPPAGRGRGRACRRYRPAAHPRGRALRRPVHGRRLASGRAEQGASPPRIGGVAQRGRADVRGNARGAGRGGSGRSRLRARGRAAHAHRPRRRAAPLAGHRPPRRVASGDCPGAGLDAAGALPRLAGRHGRVPVALEPGRSVRC